MLSTPGARSSTPKVAKGQKKPVRPKAFWTRGSFVMSGSASAVVPVVAVVVEGSIRSFPCTIIRVVRLLCGKGGLGVEFGLVCKWGVDRSMVEEAKIDPFAYLRRVADGPGTMKATAEPASILSSRARSKSGAGRRHRPWIRAGMVLGA